MPHATRTRALAAASTSIGALLIGGASVVWVSPADPVSAVLATGLLVALALTAVGAVWTVFRDVPDGRRSLLEFVAARAHGRAAPPPVRPGGSKGALVDRSWAFAEELERYVSQQRGARQRAERDERLETEFLATVSHELRTPLNAILGFSQVLLDQMDGPLTEDQREDVDTIRQSGEHLRDLVDDVLDLARIESGLFTLDRKAVQLEPIVRDVGRLLEAQRRDKPVVIETHIEEDLPPADADPKRLRQIVMNLATNALKFTDRGTVVISVSAVEDGLRVMVQDTGAGIPQDQIHAIFEEFTQVRSVKRKGQGTGLGLAICKRLVDLHDGRIDVQSVVGQGSAFAVVLPTWSER